MVEWERERGKGEERGRRRKKTLEDLPTTTPLSLTFSTHTHSRACMHIGRFSPHLLWLYVD
jgi:hypothetical protein